MKYNVIIGKLFYKAFDKVVWGHPISSCMVMHLCCICNLIVSVSFNDNSASVTN